MSALAVGETPSFTLTPPKAIIFDLDDTLYAQEEFKRSGFRAVAEWAAREPGIVDAETVVAALESAMAQHGASSPRLFDVALERMGLPLDVLPNWIALFRAHRPSIALYPGVRHLLEGLRHRFRLGLLTDGLASVQRGKIRALGIGELFDAVVCSDEFGTRKPDSVLYEGFERRFGLQGPELLYVGDNPNKDFIGARRRGWSTLRVLTGEYRDAIAPSAAHDAQDRLSHVVELGSLLGISPDRSPYDSDGGEVP